MPRHFPYKSNIRVTLDWVCNHTVRLLRRRRIVLIAPRRSVGRGEAAVEDVGELGVVEGVTRLEKGYARMGDHRVKEGYARKLVR